MPNSSNDGPRRGLCLETHLQLDSQLGRAKQSSLGRVAHSCKELRLSSPGNKVRPYVKKW